MLCVLSVCLCVSLLVCMFLFVGELECMFVSMWVLVGVGVYVFMQMFFVCVFVCVKRKKYLQAI